MPAGAILEFGIGVAERTKTAAPVPFEVEACEAEACVGVFREEVVELVPIFEGRTAADYEILIGFQLSPEQLEYNVLH